jgi:urocanate hydratase
MLENTVENGEKPAELIIYAASGKAARDWPSYDKICHCLLELEEHQTLAVQSGKPVAVFETHPAAPLVVLANTNLVPKWANWETFRQLEQKGLMMYGQYTAGSWAYIGTQGILQGTYETFAGAAEQFFGGTLKGRLVLTAGLGGMGGAQPLAVKMNQGVVIVADVDPERIQRRLDTGYCDVLAHDLDEALQSAFRAMQAGQALSIALRMNAAELYPAMVANDVIPDIVTDQTSAHDPLNGYIPAGMDISEAPAWRRENPDGYIQRSQSSMGEQVKAMLAFQQRGSLVFEYGNNIRGNAKEAGVENAFSIQGFVPLFVRPSFCTGRGPFRWVALSGNPADILKIDEKVLAAFKDDSKLVQWIGMARKQVPFQGLPARICWMGYGGRARLGLLINDMVKSGELSAPVAITRDHLDAGSVAQPTRETEGMKDGSDAVADWPLLNALLNTSAGADLVALHQGAGSGMGGSISAGMTLIADGSPAVAERIGKVLTTDPGIGVIRHADAGYEDAINFLAASDLQKI